MSLSRFSYYLSDIDQRIQVWPEDRQPYTEMFDDVRTWLLRTMCTVSPAFKKLFTGAILFGSYPNRVRLNTPKEFDVLLRLKFPYGLQLSCDDDRPGFIHLHLEDTLEQMSTDPNWQDVYEVFNEIVDYKTDTLRRGRLQWWLHDVIEAALKYGTNWRYKIKYNKRAVAHNIYVWELTYPHRKFGIDFLPAISFGKVSWMHYRRYHPFIDDYFYSFLAIPKKGGRLPEYSGKFTFMLVNPMAEREILWDKHNLKVTYRLIKSLRDRYDMDRLKSAFITHAFLWEAKRRPDHFWQRPVGEIFLYMLEKLSNYFNNRDLPYFWIKDMNMLDILKPKEITEYAQQLRKLVASMRSIARRPQCTWYQVAWYFDVDEDDYDEEDDEYESDDYDEEDDDDSDDYYYDDDDDSDDYYYDDDDDSDDSD